jgi:FKBP-type peptidyl-prolyl cis-trans isomerase 2
MSNAKNGDKVRVHYTGKLESGEVFDSSEGRNPLEFTIGENQVLKKFEESVEGLKVGDSANIFIPAAEAYGVRHDHLVVQVPKDRLPETIEPEVGMKLQTQTADGPMVVQITEVGESEVTIDANHELADKNLNFDIKLVEIL